MTPKDACFTTKAIEKTKTTKMIEREREEKKKNRQKFQTRMRYAVVV